MDNHQHKRGQAISTKTGFGIDQLIETLTQKSNDYNQQQTTFIARKRHVEALIKTLDNLQNASSIYQNTNSGELMAEDLRLSLRSLNQITGEYSTEDLLGNIFSSFCIGK